MRSRADSASCEPSCDGVWWKWNRRSPDQGEVVSVLNRWFMQGVATIKKRPRRRGMALVVVLMLISILGLLFGLGGRGNGPSLQTAGESNARNIAYFTAQGALQRGLTELRLDPAYGGKTNGKFPGAGGSTFDIKVVRNTGGTPKRSRYRSRIHASYGHRSSR